MAYQPGLKGPTLYILNGSCLFIFYYSIYTSISSLPRPAVSSSSLRRAAVVVYPCLAAPIRPHRFPPSLVVVPRPVAIELSSATPRRRRLARPRDLAVSESYASREVLSLAPWPASTPCPAHHPPQLVF